MGQQVKNLPAMQETQEMLVLSLGQEEPPREGNGNPLQHSCLENPMDRGGYSPWGCKDLDTAEQLNMHTAAEDTACCK